MNQVVRQTRTHIGELLSRHGLRPRHDLGQNFLIDLNLLEFLVAQAEIRPSDLILEVGSGTGSLTACLAAQAGRAASAGTPKASAAGAPPRTVRRVRRFMWTSHYASVVVQCFSVRHSPR